MNLHRTVDGADYDKVNPEDRNNHQKVAKVSRGLLTLANLVSVTGLAVTLWGIQDLEQKKYLKGTVKILGGRLCDLADGYIADKTGTKSPFGEFMDASVDKILIARALQVLGRNDIIPRIVARSFGVQNTLNAVGSIIAKARGIEHHASSTGKAVTFGQWETLLSYCAVTGINHANPDGPHQTQGLEYFADTSAAVTSLVGAAVSVDYLKTAFGPKPDPAEAASLEPISA